MRSKPNGIRKQSTWFPPCRFKTQPCRRKWRSKSVNFMQ
jgi:hypothetical protein